MGLILKAIRSGNDEFLTILEYNNTKASLPSPSEMLMERKLRTKHICSLEYLNSRFDTKKTFETLLKAQTKGKENYNKKARELKSFKLNDKVNY